MAEQEKVPSYEADGLPQKPANLDSKLPLQMCKKSNCNPHQTSCNGNDKNNSEKLANGGYYLNVAQKGKLILPTALWILLLIAGICFLTLMAALTKTVDTLDTLVELEQEKEARALMSEHLHHKRLNHELSSRDKTTTSGSDMEEKQPTPSKGNKKALRTTNRPESEQQIWTNLGDGMTFAKLSAEPLRDLDFSDAQKSPSGWFDLMPMSSSWFELPSWTSLERERQRPQQAASMLGDLLAENPESTSSIIVASGPIDSTNGQIDDSSFLGPILKSVMPMFSSILDNGGDKPLSPRLSHKNRLEFGEKQQASMISANIGNVNVHINSPSASSSDLLDKKPSQEEEINLLERSIDDLVSKLMDQRKLPTNKKQQHNHREFQTDESSPVIVHDLTHRRPMVAPLSPLINLLMPFQQMDGSMLMGGEEMMPPKPFKHHQPHHGRHGKHNHHQRLPMNDAQIIISISDDDQVRAPSRETNRHHVSNTQRPAVFGQSPYEFAQPIPFNSIGSPLDLLMPPIRGHRAPPFRHNDHHVTKAGGDAPWDALATDLAEALAADMMSQQQHSKKKKIGANQQQQPEFVLIDGSGPLVNGEQQPNFLPNLMAPSNMMVELVHPDGPTQQEIDVNQKPLGEQFNSLFGSPLISKILNEPLRESPKDETSSTPKVTIEQTASAPANEQPINFTISQASEPKMSPDAKAKVDSLISQLPTLGPISPDEERHARKEAEEMLNDFVGTMFTLPQMAGDQQRASTTSVKPSGVKGSPADKTEVETTDSLWIVKDVIRANNTKKPDTDKKKSILSKVIGLFKDTKPITTTTTATIPTTISVASSMKPVAMQITTPATISKTIPTTTSSISTTTTTTVATPTTESTTTVTPPSITEPPKTTDAQPTTSTSNAPIVEVIEEREAPIEQLPILDLSPFAKSRVPFDKDNNKITVTEASKLNESTTVKVTTVTPTTLNQVQEVTSTEAPKEKSFFQKADDFINRNVLNLKKLINNAHRND